MWRREVHQGSRRVNLIGNQVTAIVSLLFKICKCETGLKYKPSVPCSLSESFLHESLFIDVISEKWSLSMVSVVAETLFLRSF